MAHYPVGTYWAKVKEQRLTTNAKGNPTVVLVIEPVAMIDPLKDRTDETCFSEVPVAKIDRQVKMPITQNNFNIVGKKLNSCGLDFDAWEKLDQLHPQAQTLLGKHIEVVCTHDETGKYDNFDIPLGSLPIVPLDPFQAKNLDSQFGGFFKKPEAASPAPATTERPPWEPQNDELQM